VLVEESKRQLLQLNDVKNKLVAELEAANRLNRKLGAWRIGVLPIVQPVCVWGSDGQDIGQSCALAPAVAGWPGPTALQRRAVAAPACCHCRCTRRSCRSSRMRRMGTNPCAAPSCRGACAGPRVPAAG
jgi:hypothetical protein